MHGMEWRRFSIINAFFALALLYLSLLLHSISAKLSFSLSKILTHVICQLNKTPVANIIFGRKYYIFSLSCLIVKFTDNYKFNLSEGQQDQTLKPRFWKKKVYAHLLVNMRRMTLLSVCSYCKYSGNLCPHFKFLACCRNISHNFGCT